MIVDASKILNDNYSIKVKVTGVNKFRIRIKLFTVLVKFACFILGNKVEIKFEEKK